MIECRPRFRCDSRCWLLGVLGFSYFVAYPDDLQTVVAPLQVALGLTQSVANGVYALAAVIVVCLTWLRTHRPPRPPASDASPNAPPSP